MVHLDADLVVTLEDDRPGTLAKALGCVSGAGINPQQPALPGLPGS